MAKLGRDSPEVIGAAGVAVIGSWAFVAEVAVGAHFSGSVTGHAAIHADVESRFGVLREVGWDDVLDRARALPGVESAAISFLLAVAR